jgi:hypothetical protein
MEVEKEDAGEIAVKCVAFLIGVMSGLTVSVVLQLVLVLIAYKIHGALGWNADTAILASWIAMLVVEAPIGWRIGKASRYAMVGFFLACVVLAGPQLFIMQLGTAVSHYRQSFRG